MNIFLAELVTLGYVFGAMLVNATLTCRRVGKTERADDMPAKKSIFGSCQKNIKA